MKAAPSKIIALFFAGFFAKHIIDDIFFLIIDKYPIAIFGYTVTASARKTILVVSTILTAILLYFGLRNRNILNQKPGNV